MTWLFVRQRTRLKDDTHIFQENLQNTTRLLVDETADTLDAPTASETTNGRLGDA